jgi:hypothetical protein
MRKVWTDSLRPAHARTGKTTFIKNLLAAYAQDPDLAVNDASGPDAARVFAASPEKMCTTIVVRDHSSQTAFNYRVQDTPGARPAVSEAWERGKNAGTPALCFALCFWRGVILKRMLPRRIFSATLVLPWHQQLQQRDGASAGGQGTTAPRTTWTL